MMIMIMMLLGGLLSGCDAQPLTQAQCNTMWADKQLFRTLGTKTKAETECSVTDMKKTITDMFTGNLIKGSVCDVPWTTEYSDTMKPSKKGSGAKTILGFKDDINTACNVPKDTSGQHINCWPEAGEPPAAKECSCIGQSSEFNRLYLKDWTFCKNMRWLLCAAHGKLPRQKQAGKKITFVTAPNAIAASTAHPFLGTVTVHEICTLSHMCTNKADLFKLGKGQDFTCELPTASNQPFMTYLRNSSSSFLETNSMIKLRHDVAKSVLAPLKQL